MNFRPACLSAFTPPILLASCKLPQGYGTQISANPYRYQLIEHGDEFVFNFDAGCKYRISQELYFHAAWEATIDRDVALRRISDNQFTDPQIELIGRPLYDVLNLADLNQDFSIGWPDFFFYLLCPEKDKIKEVLTKSTQKLADVVNDLK